MKRSFVRAILAAAVGVATLAACNEILGNENGHTRTVLEAGPGGGSSGATSSSSSSGAPFVDDGSCHVAAQGDWSLCAGGNRCLPRPPDVLLSTAFSRIHLTPQGLMARGAQQNYLVADGTGAAGEPPARRLAYEQVVDLTADHDYVYVMRRTPQTLDMLRYTGDDESSLESTRTLDRLQAFKAAAVPPSIQAVGPGVLLGYLSSEGTQTAGVAQVVANWDRPDASDSNFGSTFAGADVAGYGIAYGAFGLARFVTERDAVYPDSIVAVRSDTPVTKTAAVLFGWSRVLHDDAGPVAPGAAIYQAAHAATSCAQTYVLGTRWNQGPRLGLLGNELTADLNAVLADADGGVPFSYLGGVARWSTAADGNAFYLARNGRNQNDAGSGIGEVLVFSPQLALLARFDTGGTVAQIAVSDCYLYWLDENGRLWRLLKPGSPCARGDGG